MDDLYTYMHQYFNAQSRYTFPYNEEELGKTSDKNGIYILFERGENYVDYERIVRVGSHKGKDRLVIRLGEHFLGNKQRDSIFRKHVGRCLLEQRDDGYIKHWNKPFKKRKDIEKYKNDVDLEYEMEYEHLISNYIKSNLSFTVIPKVYNSTERDRLEEGLIALLAQSDKRTSSTDWIGNHHPNRKIVTSKIWNIHFLKRKPLTCQEFSDMIESRPLI
jgi:hypothetical protein